MSALFYYIPTYLIYLIDDKMLFLPPAPRADRHRWLLYAMSSQWCLHVEWRPPPHTKSASTGAVPLGVGCPLAIPPFLCHKKNSNKVKKKTLYKLCK